VLIEVWDTGVGIECEDSEKVFTEFYQGNNPDHDRSQGLGLGLSICKRICKLLGHEFSYESRCGHGSVFRLKLPLSEMAIAPDNIREPKQIDHTGSFLNKSVLIIDDERIAREALCQVINAWGAKVILASGGKEALESLKDKVDLPDAIICDYRLNGGDNGLEVIRKVREFTGLKDIPALILTGDTAPEQVKAFKQSEFAVIHKPVHPDELFNYLNSLLAP
jgi:CheY-like chemotaxis protein